MLCTLRNGWFCRSTESDNRPAIDRKNLEISQFVIGAGAFASVYKATLYTVIDVAVKAVHQDMAEKYRSRKSESRAKREKSEEAMSAPLHEVQWANTNLGDS